MFIICKTFLQEFRSCFNLVTNNLQVAFYIGFNASDNPDRHHMQAVVFAITRMPGETNHSEHSKGMKTVDGRDSRGGDLYDGQWAFPKNTTPTQTVRHAGLVL